MKISSTDRGYIFGTQKLPDGRIVVVEADNLRQMVLSWPHHNMRAGGDWALIWVLSIKYTCVYCYRPCGGVSTLEHGNSGVDAVLYCSDSCIRRLNPTRCIPYIPLDGIPRAILPIQISWPRTPQSPVRTSSKLFFASPSKKKTSSPTLLRKCSPLSRHNWPPRTPLSVLATTPRRNEFS